MKVIDSIGQADPRLQIGGAHHQQNGLGRFASDKPAIAHRAYADADINLFLDHIGDHVRQPQIKHQTGMLTQHRRKCVNHKLATQLGAANQTTPK